MWIKRFQRIMEEHGDASGGGGDGAGADAAAAGAGTNLMGGAAASGDTGGQGDGSGGAAAAASAAAGGSSSSDSFKLGVYDADGNVDPAFLAGLSDDEKGVGKFFAKYKDDANAIKGIANLQFLAKRGEIAPLPDDAPEAAKVAQDEMLRKALGTPAVAGDYQFKLPEGMKEDGLDKEFVDGFKEFAHANRMSPATAQGLFDMALHREAAIHAEYGQKDAQLIQEGHKVLAKEYGTDLPKKIESARFGAMLADPSIDVNTDPAFSYPTTVKLAIALAERTADDSMPSGGQGAGSFGMNKLEQSRDIVNNPNNPHHAAYHGPHGKEKDAAMKLKSALSQEWHNEQKRK